MELLHGLLVYKMPLNHPHAASSSRLEKRLARRCPTNGNSGSQADQPAGRRE